MSTDNGNPRFDLRGSAPDDHLPPGLDSQRHRLDVRSLRERQPLSDGKARRFGVRRFRSLNCRRNQVTRPM